MTFYTKIIAIASFIPLLSQTTLAQNAKIRAVENNLTETRDLIFEDSLLPRFSIEDRMKYYKVPSVSMAVINNGKIEWAKTYGYADMSTQKPVNTSTLYQVASISKSINGLAVMKLVQENRLSLSRDIRTYLKTWTFPDNDFSRNQPITLKNLLSHTAGLSVRGFRGYPSGSAIPTVNQILDGQSPANNEAVKPMFAPNTQFEYSGGGTMIIKKILDDNISVDYEQLMRQLVLQPLNMKHSTYTQPLSYKHKNYALAHDQNNQPVPGGFYIYPELAAGGLWSTASDIAKFVIAVQQAVAGKSHALLNKKYAEEMLTPVLDNYALGFGIVEKGGEKYFYHEGECYGFRSVYYGSFTTGKGVAILTNAYPDNAKKLTTEILNNVATVYNWKDFYNPVKKKLVALNESQLMQYAGEYFSEKPDMKISIVKNGDHLELTARRPERMYPTGENTFFLASSPNDICRFSSSGNDGQFNTFEVIQDGKTMIQARRKG